MQVELTSERTRTSLFKIYDDDCRPFFRKKEPRKEWQNKRRLDYLPSDSIVIKFQLKLVHDSYDAVAVQRTEAFPLDSPVSTVIFILYIFIYCNNKWP